MKFPSLVTDTITPVFQSCATLVTGSSSSLRTLLHHTVPYRIKAAVVPTMDTDSTASSGQQSTYESDDALEDIGVLFKDSLGKPTICCWNEAEIWYGNLILYSGVRLTTFK